MPFPLSAEDLHLLMDEADAAARRLRRRQGLPHHDLDDLRQDLLADLVARLPHYDPDRGGLGAFAGVVLRNRAARLAGRVARHRRMHGFAPVSLDAPLADGDGATVGDLVGEAEGLSAWHGQPTDARAAAERRIDVERALGSLQRRDGALAAALASKTPDRLAAEGAGSRSGLYRRIREIRMSLAASGLAAA